MLGYCHKYPIALEYVAELILWGKPGKLIAALFPKYNWFLSITFPSCGMLYHKGTHGFSHQFTGKHSKVHPMREK